MPFIIGDKFIRACIDAGVIGNDCQEFVIHAKVGESIKVYTQTVGDDRLVRLIAPEIRVVDTEAEAGHA